MHAIATELFAIFRALGGFGLLVMGVLDSSFLFMPLGNDLLVIAMTARNTRLMPYYAGMASLGSVLGCLLVDVVFRKGGEEALERHVVPRRLEYVRAKVEKSAGWALAAAALMPPPFPFTPFVAAAAALQYPRGKLLAVIGASRLVRFTVEGALAISMGSRILQWAKSPVLETAVVCLLLIFVAGSVVSLYRWMQRSRRVEAS